MRFKLRYCALYYYAYTLLRVRNCYLEQKGKIVNSVNCEVEHSRCVLFAPYFGLELEKAFYNSVLNCLR